MQDKYAHREKHKETNANMQKGGKTERMFGVFMQTKPHDSYFGEFKKILYDRRY